MNITLPLPPSVNALYFNAKHGRVRTRAYTSWIAEADGYYLTQKTHCRPVLGPYAVSIQVPSKMRGDIDNRQKAILDWLVSRELTPDDKHLHRLTIVRGDTIGPKVCEIEVREIG